MTKVLNSNETYVRLMGSDGTALTHSAGILSVGIASLTNANHDDFQVNANIQVENQDIALGQYDMTSCLPVVLAADHTAVPVIATDLDIRTLDATSDSIKALSHENTGNMYDNATTNSRSSKFDKSMCRHVSIIGVISAPVTIIIEASDTENGAYYETGYSLVHTSGGASSFHINVETCFPWIQLALTESVTITAIAHCMN